MDRDPSETVSDKPTPRPIIFGEILFDHFPDGTAVIGGAPLNVAIHLQRFGREPLMISRVGDDDEGRRAREVIASYGLSTDGIQTDPRLPTGKVQVELDASGTPTYDIVDMRAYDAIDADEAVAVVRTNERPAMLYHGTLALRHDASRAALDALIGVLPEAPRFVDVNLREPWWSRDDVRRVVAEAQWLKLNDEELTEIGEADGGPAHDRAEQLRRDARVGNLLVTLGADGALLLATQHEAQVHERPPEAETIVDTVGAGDALSSVMIHGALGRWAPRLSLQRGLAFATAVCGLRGAVPPPDSDFHDRFLNDWTP
jgi:fructokinase